MNNKAIITASVGSDVIEQPRVVLPGFDYIAFTDDIDKHPESVWNLREAIPFSSVDLHYKNRRDAKQFKVLSPLLAPGYDTYIWMDPTHAVEKNPMDGQDEDVDIVFFQHKLRTTVYQEMAELRRYTGYEKHAVIDAQEEYYQTLGYDHVDLFECPIFAMRHNPVTIAYRLAWWEHICRWSSRDQLSAPFAAHIKYGRHKVNYKVLDVNIQDVANPQFHNRPYYKFKDHDHTV